jgi:hypothetical protein
MQACARTRREGERFHLITPRQLNARFGQLPQHHGKLSVLLR